MALDAVGLQQPLRYTVDLQEGLVQQPMSSQLMKGDKKANCVIVRITNGSETVDLAGVGVSGSFIRPPDEAELTLAGSVNGNEAVIVLDDLCYAEEGYCEIDVKLTVNSVSRTILALTGYVLAKGNGAYIDVGNVIPNIDDIIAQYAEMKAVTERTLAAAQRAEALAIDASGYAANTGMLGGQPPSYYAKQEDVTQLSQQIDEKAKKSGWTPNKIIGSDASGNLVAQDPPEDDGGDADTLGGKPPSDYLLKNDAYQMKLLWPNPSPTSTFAPQTVTIDNINNYDWYGVLLAYNNASDATSRFFMTRVGTGLEMNISSAWGTLSGRKMTVDGIYFNFWNGITTGGAENNTFAIPLGIYGIKGVVIE